MTGLIPIEVKPSCKMAIIQTERLPIDAISNMSCQRLVLVKCSVWGRTGLVVRASDSGSGDPGSILGRVGVLFP